jgi:hypothetical protein
MRVRFGSERIITVDGSFVGNILNRLALLLPEVVQIAVETSRYHSSTTKKAKEKLVLRPDNGSDTKRLLVLKRAQTREPPKTAVS